MDANNEIINRKLNKELVVLIILLIFIIIGLISYIVYDKVNSNDNKVPEVTKSNIPKKYKAKEEKIEARNLNEEELNFFKIYFNNTGINGFLTQEFNNPKDINLFTLLYNGIGKQESITDDEIKDILNIYGYDELYTELQKIKSDDIKEFLKTNADLDFSKGSSIKNFDYLSKYDAYYHMHGDTSFLEIETCSNGKIDENGNYILNCKFKYDDMETQTTLKKKDDNYIFISNKCIGNCEYLPGNVDNRNL